MIPTQMSMRSKMPITDLDAPDGRTQNMENQQTLNNNNAHNTMTNNNSQSNSNHTGTNHSDHAMTTRTTECNNRKSAIPLNQSKRNNSNYNDDPEKRSIAGGDPIYQTISSEKSGAKSLRRNCISLENLRTLTIKNDLNSYGNNLLQNQIGQPQSQFYILPAFPPSPLNYHVPYFNPKPQLVYGPPPPRHMMAQHLKANHRTPFANYGGYANPNPYFNLSNTNSRQSIGNDSDDYRKYRDVAL